MKRLKELETYYLALLIVCHAVRVPSTCSRCAGHVGELRKEKGGGRRDQLRGGAASKALVHTHPLVCITQQLGTVHIAM